MKFIRIGFIAALLAVLIVGAWLFYRRNRPVVWAIREKGESTGHSIAVWLNPFRDRSTERVCEVALKALRDGDFQVAGSALQGVKKSTDIIDHERKNRVKKWKVSDVKIEGETAVLYYDAMRVDGGDSTPINIFLKRNGDVWQIVDWESWY